MKVIWKKSHAQFSYFAGNSADLSEKQIAKYKLLEDGFVQFVPTDDDEGGNEINALPEDLPGRVPFFNGGINAVDDLVKLAPDGFTEVEGIGEGTAKKVLEWLVAEKHYSPIEE